MSLTAKLLADPPRVSAGGGRRQTSVELSPESREMWAALEKTTGLSRSEVVEVAIFSLGEQMLGEQIVMDAIRSS